MAVSAVVESAAQIVVPSELSASVGQAVEALLFCMTVSFAMGEMPPKQWGLAISRHASIQPCGDSRREWFLLFCGAGKLKVQALSK
jgi:hypothetical protein